MKGEPQERKGGGEEDRIKKEDVWELEDKNEREIRRKKRVGILEEKCEEFS